MYLLKKSAATWSMNNNISISIYLGSKCNFFEITEKNVLITSKYVLENKYIQYFRKGQIKDSYFSSYFIFIISLIGETDVKEEEDRHPVQQISDELKADMVNECVEKLVSPKDVAADMVNECVEKLHTAWIWI